MRLILITLVFLAIVALIVDASSSDEKKHGRGKIGKHYNGASKANNHNNYKTAKRPGRNGGKRNSNSSERRGSKKLKNNRGWLMA